MHATYVVFTFFEATKNIKSAKCANSYVACLKKIFNAFVSAFFAAKNSPNRLSKVLRAVGGKPSIQDFGVCRVDPEWPGIKTFSPAVLSSFIRA